MERPHGAPAWSARMERPHGAPASCGLGIARILRASQFHLHLVVKLTVRSLWSEILKIRQELVIDLIIKP